MNSAQLDRLANKDVLLSRLWGGVLAADEVPDQLESGRIFVINDQPRHIHLGHWRLVYTFDPYTAWFCSYGIPPKNLEIIQTLHKLNKPLLYNKQQLQQFNTTTCAMHTLFVGMMLARDLELEEIIERFYSQTDLLQNDLMVQEYLRVVLDMKSVPPLFDTEFLTHHQHGTTHEQL